MQKLIDELYRFDRRPVYAIYGVPSDFGFACMDKVSIAVDLGFRSRQAGVVTAVAEHPFASVKEVEDFPWHVSLDGAQAQAELEMLRGWLANNIVHQGGGCFGPLTVAACIVGVEECVRMVHKRPEVLHAVLRRVTDFMLLLAREEQRLGADSFWIAEPVASLLSPRSCRVFCTPYLKEIFDALDIPGVLHVCGNTDPHLGALLETGAQALSIDWCTDLVRYLEAAPDDVVIMGNISPMLLWQGTQDEVRAQTEALMRQTRDYKNFVLATGCQVPSAAPRENVELMLDIGRSFPVWSNDQYRLIHQLANLYCQSGSTAFDVLCTQKDVPAELRCAAENMARRRLENGVGKRADAKEPLSN